MNRKQRSSFFVFTIALLLGCREDVVDGQLTLAQGEQVKLHNGLMIQVNHVNDSRCPGGDIQCIRAGEAYVRFTLSNNAATQRDTLCIGTDCPRFIKKANKATYFVGGQQLNLELLQIAGSEAIFRVD